MKEATKRASSEALAHMLAVTFFFTTTLVGNAGGQAPLAYLVGLIIVLTMVPMFAAILRIPFSIIAPIILVICAIGAYTVHNSTFDVVMMLVFGIIGYVLKKTDYPLAPMVLAIVLGDKAEEAFRQSLLASQGKLGVFWSNPLVSSIMALSLIALFWPIIQNGLAWIRRAPKAA